VNKGRFTGVGKTDDAHIGDELQLQAKMELAPGLSGLSKSRRSVSGAFEMGVAPSTPPALGDTVFVSGVQKVFEQFSGGRIDHQRSGWKIDNQIFTLFAGFLPALAVASVLGFELVFEVKIVKRAFAR
jgi:hypothetical protein